MEDALQPMMTLQYTCLAGFFFILACIARRSVALGLAGRPLFWSLLWGGITGIWFPFLFIAIFLELIWLDLYYIGNQIPPFAALPFFIFLVLHSIVAPPFLEWSVLALITTLMLVMPVTCLHSLTDRGGWFFTIRAHENLVATKNTTAPLGNIAVKFVWRSIAMEAGCGLALLLLSCIFYYPVFSLVAKALPPDSDLMGVLLPTGPKLLTIADKSFFPAPLVYWLVPAALGGLISLRIEAVRLFFAVIMGILIIAGMWGTGKFF